MRNYIKADLLRMVRRIPQLVVTLIVFAVFAVAVLVSANMTRLMADPAMAEFGMGVLITESFVFDAAAGIIPFFTSFVGLFAMIFVFSDDFKAKTAQIAIGAGVSRSRIIFSKLIEVLILLAVNAAAFGGITLLMNGILGGVMSGAQYAELAGLLVMNMVVTNMAYLSLVTVILFSTQSMIMAILAFLALSFHMVSGAVGMTEFVKMLEPLKLNRFTLTTFIEQTGANLTRGTFDVKPVLGMILYMTFGVSLASFLFRRKELEF